MASRRTDWGVPIDRLQAESVGSNPAQGMDVRPRVLIIIHLSLYHRLYTV